jgi:hypothetical protein
MYIDVFQESTFGWLFELCYWFVIL